MGTLAWFSMLNRPLDLDNLHRLLLRHRVTREELEQKVTKLDEVERHGDLVSLKGASVREPDEEMLRWYRYKWWRVRLAVGLLRHVPFVRLVAVANTLADQTTGKNSDIDLFIVIEDGRMYLTRTIITFLLQVTGLRRTNKKIANRFCLSFFVTTESLDLQPVAFAPYDLYLAYWITELVPALDGAQTFERLRAANRWVEHFVPRYHETKFPPRGPSWVSKLAERLLRGRLTDKVEERLMRWQHARIRAKAPKEEPLPPEPDERADVRVIATDRMLKFHEKERRRVYRARWESEMRRRGYDPELILSTE